VLPAPDDSSLTLGRRIGVLVVLAALGFAIVLAASGGREDDGTHGVVALPSTAVVALPTDMADAAATYVPVVGAPTGQPTFVTPDSTLVSKRRKNLQVRVPDPGVPWDGLELRVLRGGTEILTQRIGPDDINAKGRVTLKGVPLKRGSNRLAVVFANASGTGPPSDTLSIRLDDLPPRLKVTAPRDGATLNADDVVVKGRTVPGLRVIVRNVTTDQKEEAFADGEGRFQAQIGLKRGRDTIKVAVADAVGNQATKEVVIVRGNGKAEADLALSRHRVRRSALPKAIDATVTVRDAEGRPIKGARVEFTFAPRGQGAQVNEDVTSKMGVATWSGMRVLEGTDLGDGLVSVRVILPDGKVLNQTAEFRVV